MSALLYEGDCFKMLRGLKPNSIDAVITDPPYHLSTVKRFGSPTAAPARDGDVYARSSRGFMGQQWDGGDIAFNPELWARILRVLKPGGHVVTFGGTRTYHRMACAIEDGGFEIRDQLAWVYGSGFPKSHDVSKGIDKLRGAEREVIGRRKHPTLKDSSLLEESANAAHGSNEWAREWDLTAPASDESKQYEGWGTALKPAFEPICLARKPLSESTVAANVLRWGTGAINIDATRVTGGGDVKPRGSSKLDTEMHEGWSRPWMENREDVQGRHDAAIERANTLGRWPANLCHDGSEEVLAMFPETARAVKSVRDPYGSLGYHGGASELPGVISGHEDNGGSAARFFYCAKASKADRAYSNHPTVKPIKLMRWLVRLITPVNGLILDPFAGTGTTAHAAILEGFDSILMEREREYCIDIERRLAQVKGKNNDGVTQNASRSDTRPGS